MKKLIQLISLLLITTAVLSAQPKWSPVIYTNSTTLYGKVSINGVPAQLGDRVGVFVGSECRGVADVVTNLGEGYVSLLIQGEVTEEASFQIWKQNNDVVYKVVNKVTTSPGGTIGTPPDYFLIDGKGPNWKPIIYTNSTTFYGEVFVNGIPAQPGDIVGAFVNGECRGREEVIINNGSAYITMLIQGETAEKVTFQLWQNSSGKELLIPRQIQSDPGGTIPLTNINAIDGLVALYNFTGNLNDATENGFDITGNGLTFASDRFNNQNSALAFDGTTSQAEVANSTSLDYPKNGFTISTWVKFANTPSAVVFGKHVHGYANGYFLAAENNHLQFYVSGTPLNTSETFNDNIWHLVTGVYDGLNATLYVDGVEKISRQIPYTAFSPNPVRLAYMQTPGYPAKYNGLIDDARIYNIPLSKTDVSNLFGENNWTAQEITNLNPNGENWIKANSIYRIDWTASQFIDSVKIEFTPDDGNTWQTITPSVQGNSEGFYWKVPRISTTQAKIKISHLFSGVSTISSAPFIIALPEITVGSPNGGELWQRGSQQNINWNSTNIQQVKIDYSTNGGTNWFPIANSIAATPNNFNWTVANDTSRNALIRVSDADDSTFFDVSDAPFTIFQPKLNITKPLGGERFRLGTTQNISWTSEFVNKIKIEFSQDNGLSWTVLPGADSVLASLSTFNWMPNVETKQAIIRISDFKNSALQSTSNAFEIFVPKLTLTSPNGGEQWRTGTTQKITWTSSDVSKVKIQYTTNDGTNWIVVADSALASTGNFDWTIPTPITNQAKVRLTDYKDVTVSSQSVAPFVIYFPTLTLNSPKGGELWQIGTQKNISWTSTYLTKVKLEYTTDGTTWKLIADQIDANLNNYLWTIPNDPSTSAKVKISDATENLVSAASAGAFTIYQQKLTLTSPLGGERYLIGVQKNVTWTSEYVNKIKIEFSQDNGSSWSVLPGADSVLASVSSFPWFPNVETKLAKIRISDSKNIALTSVSSAFEIFKPKITVTSPNGSEQWVVGTTQNITWTSSDVADVKLEYTTNNGTNWISILATTPASAGSSVWTIPNTPSATAKVRISDVTNSLFADTSDNVFSIILPKLTIVKPNGGESFVVGKIDTIKWTSSNVSNVKLEYTTDNGTNWISILTSTPASSGSFTWTIPNTPSTNCKVRISDVGGVAVPDLSDNVFSIILPKVTVTSPNGAEQWVVGTTQNITWTSSNVANVKLEYSIDNGANWISILASTPASAGSFVWTTPNTPSANCKVRISDVAGVAVPDQSDNVFSIILPKVTVTSPNGGEQWIVGTNQNISWTSSNVANVKLEYTTNNGTNWISILASTSASAGSYSWTIPNTPSTNCKVRISDVTNSLFADTSNNVFSIILPRLTLLKPNGGEIFPIAKTDTIKWTSSNVVNVKLEFTTDNGVAWIPIANSTPAAAGSYLWSVPPYPSTNCKVRISDVTNSLVADTSNNPFTIILPTLTVLKPNGGEVFVVGKTDTIKWTSTYVDNVQIQYSTDNSTTWTTIVASTPANTGSFLWTIPNTPSTNCKVWISDVAKVATSKMSTNNFSIVLPKITVLKPNGGESFIIGKTDTIKWSSSNVVNVKLEYSIDNGTNWISILASTPASAGSFVWTIPNTPSTNCLVKVSDVANISLPDVSDNVFSIILPQITLIRPNGGENLIVGKTDTIKWSSSNVTSVKLEYHIDKTNWITITESTPAANGSFIWTIPNTPSPNCEVRISDAANTTFADTSDSPFSIIFPKVTLLRPNGGDRFIAGKADTIRWTSSDIAALKIEYSTNNGTNWLLINSSVPANTLSFVWTVPNTPSANCVVKISDILNPEINDLSDGTFSILTPTITLTSPNGGEQWKGGSEQSITWTQKDLTTLKIEYTLDDNSWITISESVEAALGSYKWLVPNVSSTSARVRLTETTDTLIRDVSDAVFTIFVPRLFVVKPNGGETFVAGKTDTIKWTSSNIENVKIEFTSDNGQNWNPIIASTPASSGNIVWTIPTTSSKNCKVRISDVLNSEMTDISDGVFTIVVPTITLTAPNGGEKWLAQTNHQITWTSSDLDSVRIDFSFDNGTTWNVLAPKVFAWYAIYNWNVESLPTSQALVRVAKYDDLSVQDVSDNVFTIYKEALAVTSPNGGEKLRAKTVVPITWNISEIVNPKAIKRNLVDTDDATIAPIQNVKIEFTLDNGSNWSTLAASVNAGLKSYNWEIPAIESKNCLIRITDTEDATHSDTSDNAFEIYNPRVIVTSPNGGEKWRTSTTQKISWISNEISKIKIEYSTNDGFQWKVISDSVDAATETIDWKIPAERTSRARVRITDVSLASTADTSDHTFTIVVPEITLTSPAGGENWKTNTVQQIKWNSLDVEFVLVEFSSDNGTSWLPLKDSVLASSGLYNWTIPRTPTEQAKIRVSDVNYKEISAVSNVFSIIKPLALLVPQGGEKWFSGSTQQVKWNFNFVDSVKLEYSLNNSASWQLIANSLPATLLAYDWKIPQNISSTHCRVKITDRNNILTADSSAEVFTIMTPTLTVLTPNGGENLKGGTEYQLTWKNQNSDSLIIDYTIDNGANWTSISKSTNAKTEKLTWVIPKVTSTQCRIRVIDKFYSTVGDTSDKVFSIYTPEITIVTPKGGETWYVGETKQIKWKSSFVESVKIVLTTDDGNSWRTLTNAVSASDSVFSLFIEKITSTNCRIKIWATEDSTVIDSSRSNFAIAILPPTIHVSILQNPVLTQYCNVVLISDSLLSALPTTTVWRTGVTERPVYEMNPIQNSTNVFECSVKFDTTGIYNFQSRVVSKMGIEKDTLRQFAVGVALPNLFAKVTSKNEGLTLAINPGVVEEKTFFSIEEEKVNKEIFYNIQPARTFKKAINVTLSFENESFEEVYKFSVFVFENGEWKPVQSEVNKKTKTVTASLTTLGKVKLGIDINKKEVIDLPKTFALIQNYPNPFNPSTVIAYHLPEDCEFTLEIYNMLGARISTLYSGFAVAGRYSVTWNGMNDANVQVPSGIYLYRLKTSKFDQVRKMILLK